MRSFVPLTVAAALAAVTAAPAAGQEAAPATRIRLDLSVPAGTAAGEIVRGGVPFPRELNLTDPSKLGLWRATSADLTQGEWIPAQWQVISRHQGTIADTDRPARWALLEFPAHGGGTYWLRSDVAAAAPNVAPVAADLADRIDVDTGLLRFSVAKDRYAVMGGLRTVSGGTERAAVAPSGLDAQMTLVERDAKGAYVDRTYRLSKTVISDVAVEENGPHRAAIRIRGKFTDEKGQPLLFGFLGYTMRIWADRGSDSLRVFFTLENNGVYGPPADGSRTTAKPMWVRIRDLQLEVPTTMAPGRVRGATSDGAWDLKNGGDGVELRLVQTHKVVDRRNEAMNFRYAVSVQGAEVAKGARSMGGIQVDDGTTSVAADVRHFWQSYPKAMSFDDGRLQVELFPRIAGEKWPEDLPEKFGDAYEFEGGRHKTYEVMFSFAPSPALPAPDDRTPDPRPRTVTAREKALHDPPTFSVDPLWVKRSSAAGGAFALVDGGMPNPSLADARAHFAKLQCANVDVNFADAQGPDGEIPPCSMVEQRETRGHALLEVAPYDMDMYGYMSFGDLPHDKGFCAGHHDWVRGLFLNWMRFQKREFLDRGIEMLRHRYDIDQYHCAERADPNWKWYNGFQRAEVGFHGARLAEFHPHGESTGNPQGTWLEGLLQAYAVTGDPRALECARENADAFMNYFQVSGALDKNLVRGQLDYMGQLSAMSNGVQQLLAFYEFTGERRYFDVAWQVYENGLLTAEEYYGNKGFFDLPNSPQLQVYPVVRLVQPLIEMHRHSNDPRALSMLLRILNFFREDGYDGGALDENDHYMPLQLPYMWELEGGQPVAKRYYICYSFFTADGFAWAYLHTKEPSYMDWARRVWRDAVLFYQAPMHQAVPPGWYSAASYAPRQYPNSETKVGAWMLNQSQYYLAIEELLTGSPGAQPVEFLEDPWFDARRRWFAANPPLTRRLPPVPHAPASVSGTVPMPPSAPTSSQPPAPASSSSSAPAQPAGATPPAPPRPAPTTQAPPTTTSSNVPATSAPTPHQPTNPTAPTAPAPAGPTPRASDSPVGQPRNQNPAPRTSDVDALTKPIEMDDRDAVFAGAWRTDTAKEAYVNTMHVAEAGSANATATFTVPVARSGSYRLYLWWPDVAGAATNTPVEVSHEGGWDRFLVNQKRDFGRWRLIATVVGSPSRPVVVKFGGTSANGAVIADAVKLEPVAAGNASR